MTVRARLLLTLVGIAALLVLPALYAVSRLAELRDIALEQREEHASAFRSLGRLQAALAELDRFQRSYIITGGEDTRLGMREALAQARLQLVQFERSGHEAHARGAGAILDTLQAATATLERLVHAGQREEATDVFDESIKPLFAEAGSALDRIATTIDRSSEEDIVKAGTISASAVNTMLIAVAITLTLALVLGVWSARILTTPVLRLRRAMAGVAGGEFSAPPNLPYARRDEIGDLSRSFRSMTQRLAELDRLKAEFISMASHDLKTPISVIGGYSELLEEGLYGELNAKQREVLRSVLEQTRVLARLVNQLLDISRIEAGGFRIELEDVQLAELMSSVRRAFEALARQKRIDFDVDVDASTPAVIKADPHRLRNEVLGNLLSNAFKFTPEGGRVFVRVWGEEDGVHLQVGDSGVGISPEELPHIFEKYYQVGQQARAKGAGLGLAIAREITEAHGGSIRVESEPGQGSLFHIVLPPQSIVMPAGATA